jgi:serine/threonine-protein kinase
MTTDGSSARFELTLLQERSAGTFARVYLAEARSRGGIDRIVAVKVLKDQWSEHDEMMVRTRDEARLLARLHHKNILGVEAMTQIQGQPAIVMEFVDGIDLGQLIEQLRNRGRSLPPRAAYRVAADTASALHAAYFRVPFGRSAPLKVVHRDLKPSNIMLSIEGEVKVLDFGTARFTSEARVAQTGVLRFGSMKYMSPERRLGDRGDHASDIYALGLVLLEILLGREIPQLPLERAEHDTELERVIGQLPDHGLPNEEWAESLRQTLRCMCAPDPGQRLDAGQALELLRAFADQAAGESLEAFAMSTVGPITREVYGDGVEGDLSGSRIFVGPPVDSASPRQLAPLPAPSATRPMDSGELRAAAQAYDGPTRFEPAPTSVAAQPAPAAQPSQAAAHPPPAATPAAPPAAPPATAANSSRTALIIGGIVGVLGVGLLGLVVLGGVGWWLWNSTPAGPAVAVDERPATAAPAADGHPVVLRAGDETIRWIKVYADGSTPVLSGRPDIDGSLASGAYTLKAKVAGRATAAATLDIEGPLTLDCTPQKKGVVRCEGDDGARIELRP